MSRKLDSKNILRLQQTYRKLKRIEEDLSARTRALFLVGHRYSFHYLDGATELVGRVTGFLNVEPTALRVEVLYLNSKEVHINEKNPIITVVPGCDSSLANIVYLGE